jgi:S-adenosylmethionine decarboxylase
VIGKLWPDKGKKKMWGKSTLIDLGQCNLKIISRKNEIERYIDLLVDLIKMEKFGDCIIEHFGKDKKVEGYSMMQFIQTSSIVGHFVNHNRSAYIDIFSCGFYNSLVAAEFTKEFFEAETMAFTIRERI